MVLLLWPRQAETTATSTETVTQGTWTQLSEITYNEKIIPEQLNNSFHSSVIKTIKNHEEFHFSFSFNKSHKISSIFIPFSDKKEKHQFLPQHIHTLSSREEKVRRIQLIKWPAKGNYFDVLKILSTIFREMGGNQPGQFVYGYWGLKDKKAANIKLSRPRPSKLLSGAGCVLGKMHCTGLS